MAYTPSSIDDSRGAEDRLIPRAMTCLKLAVSTTADYKLLPRDVKSCTLYCAAACWVRVDKVTADDGAKSLATTTQDNVLYVPAGTFVIAQQTEFNQITAKTVTGSDTLYIYPGQSANLSDLVAEAVLA